MEFGERTQHAVERELVERESLDQHAACGIGYAHKVEVALKQTILAGRAVNGDVGEVELVLAVGGGEREVVAVYAALLAVIVDGPLARFNLNQKGVVLFLVHEGHNSLG